MITIVKSLTLSKDLQLLLEVAHTLVLSSLDRVFALEQPLFDLLEDGVPPTVSVPFVEE